VKFISGNSGHSRDQVVAVSSQDGVFTRLRTGLGSVRARLAEDDAPQPRAGILRGPRFAALVAIAVLVATASGAAFAESYRGLYEWAGHHWLSGFWQDVFPLQVDEFIAVGELVLFVALLDGWRTRSRLGAWLVTLAGLAVSVAGNIGHVASPRITDRGTAAIPPLAAAAALAVGLGVLKRVVARRANPGAPELPPDPAVIRAALNGHAARAERLFSDDIAAGRVPGIRRIMTGMKVGDEKARLIQQHLRNAGGSDA
jgi:hypothetical protein